MTAPNLSGARAIADLTSGVILATVEIAAPAERVFRALTDPKELIKWWGAPEVYQTEKWNVDLRVGGHWEVHGHSADGTAFLAQGVYRVIEPPTRIVLTWEPSWFPEVKSTLSYQLEAVPGGTRVTLRHEGFAGHVEARKSHTAGWEQVLGWLAAYVDAESRPRPSFAARFFNPLRVATYLLLLYAFVHTAGALFNTPSFSPAADAVLASMRSVRFPVQGVERTWFNFWFGFGIIDSVFFVSSAAIAWFLGGRSWTERRAFRAITWILFLGYAASIGIILKDFFAGPLLFSSLITICFGIECWNVTRSTRARG